MDVYNKRLNFTGKSMKTGSAVICVVLILVLASCAPARRPVLYPNNHLNRVGEQQADADISACMRAAETSGANANRSEDVARKTAKAGAVGASTGAVVGAISSDVSTGRGAAVGGAGAATATLVGGAFDASEPTQIYKRFVDQCLRDKGYQPIGWR